MICDEIPHKEDRPVTAEIAEPVTATGVEVVVTGGETAVAAMIPVEVTTNDATTDTTAVETTATEAAGTRKIWWPTWNMATVGRRWDDSIVYVRTRNQQMRQLWCEQQARLANNRDHTQIVFVIVLTLLAIGCNVAAITTNNWICSWGGVAGNNGGAQELSNYGLWNTCFLRNLNQTTGANETITNMASVTCAHQEMNRLSWSVVDQSRVDQVTAAQALITAGTVVYALSLIGSAQACKLLSVQSNLNVLRNLLVMSMFVQIVAFLMNLIGLFLYILTEHISMSIGLLFVYFGIAIFATNFINFITIEYKCYKFRSLAL